MIIYYPRQFFFIVFLVSGQNMTIHRKKVKLTYFLHWNSACFKILRKFKHIGLINVYVWLLMSTECGVKIHAKFSIFVGNQNIRLRLQREPGELMKHNLNKHVSVTVLSSKVRRNIDGDHFLMATRLMHDNHCIFPRITVMRITKQTNSRWRALARKSAAKNDTFYGYNNMNTYNASIYNIYLQHIINTMVRSLVHCHVFIRV